MKYLIILDYMGCTVNIHPYNNPDDEEDEDLLKDLGHNPGDCSWMITDKLDLHISL